MHSLNYVVVHTHTFPQGLENHAQKYIFKNEGVRYVTHTCKCSIQTLSSYLVPPPMACVIEIIVEQQKSF